VWRTETEIVQDPADLFRDAAGRGLMQEDMAALVKLWEETARVMVNRRQRG
jgi:hypothetical protein